MATRERRIQMQSFEMEEQEELVANSPSKVHSRQPRWTDPGNGANLLGGFPEIFLQCFGTASGEAHRSLAQKCAAMESRLLEMSEMLLRERELRTADLAAFDAQSDVVREEKEAVQRELDDLTVIHQGNLDRLHEVQSQADSQTEEIKQLQTRVQEADSSSLRWHNRCSQLEIESQELREDLEAAELRRQTEADQAEAALQQVCLERQQELSNKDASHRAELNVLQSLHDQERERNRALETAARQHESEMADVNASLERAKKDVSRAEEELRAAVEENAALQTVELSLREEIKSTQNQLSTSAQQAEELQQVLQERTNELEAAEQRHKEEVADKDQEARQYQLECTNLGTQLADSQAAVFGLQATLAASQASLSDLKAKQSDLEGRLKASGIRETELRGEVQDSQVKLKASLLVQKDAESKIEELESQGQAAKLREESLGNNASDLEARLQAGQAHIEGLQTELDQARQTVEKAEQEAESVGKVCDGLRGELQSAKKSQEEQQGVIKELEEQVRLLEVKQREQGQNDQDLASAYAAEHDARVEAQNRARTLEKQWLDAKETSSLQERDLEILGSQLEALEAELAVLRGRQPFRDDSQVLEDEELEAKARESSEAVNSASSYQPHQNGTSSSLPDNHAIVTENEPSASETGAFALSGVFAERKEWQAVCAEGLAQGWLLSADQVLREEVIGKGSFGETYRGLHQEETVAVKCVRVSREIEAKIFLRELKALARVSHANLMAFRGAVLDPPHTCWLVVEYLPGGTLNDWLYGKEGRGAPRRSLQEKVDMGIGIAKGMLALEATDPPIMHRDLKPTNVLLDAAGAPKISDFGLCREHLESEAYSYTGETGSYTYMSPEMMRGEMYGPNTDVYSFAVLLAEILRQRPPFEEFYLSPVQVAEGVAYQDIRPALPSNVPSGLKYLIEACWCPEPEGRPDFSTITGHLIDIAKSLPTKRGFWS